MKINLRILISLILNIIIFAFLLTGTIIAFVIGDGILTATFPEIFKYFTFQSNVFMGIVAFIYAFFQLLILSGTKEKMPHVLNVFYHVGVTAVGLTFLVVIIFLAPGYGFDKMYNYANLFFHALLPIVAIINYLFLLKECSFKFLHTLFAVIPSFLYGIVYFIVVASLNGYGDLKIDFYMFGKDGPLVGAFNFVAIISIAYIIGVALYFINYLVFKKRK